MAPHLLEDTFAAVKHPQNRPSHYRCGLHGFCNTCQERSSPRESAVPWSGWLRSAAPVGQTPPGPRTFLHLHLRRTSDSVNASPLLQRRLLRQSLLLHQFPPTSEEVRSYLFSLTGRKRNSWPLFQSLLQIFKCLSTALTSLKESSRA